VGTTAALEGGGGGGGGGGGALEGGGVGTTAALEGGGVGTTAALEGGGGGVESALATTGCVSAGRDTVDVTVRTYNGLYNRSRVFSAFVLSRLFGPFFCAYVVGHLGPTAALRRAV
jgi:hypothetical protein